jgi:hypothetical protein
MRLLDSPIIAGRTAREAALTGIGTFGVLWGLVGGGPYGVEWSFAWAVVTALFAARFWAARGIAAGACMAAVAQWGCVSGFRAWPWILNVPVVALALLASRDLEARFEESPSRVRWLPNPWAAMPREHARRLRWSAYAASVMAAVLCQMWCSGERAFPATPAFFWAVGAMVALLAVGRAVMLLPLAGAAIAVTVAELPRALGGHVGSMEAVVCAIATAGLAAPYVVRLLRGPGARGRVRVAAAIDEATATRVDAEARRGSRDDDVDVDGATASAPPDRDDGVLPAAGLPRGVAQR